MTLDQLKSEFKKLKSDAFAIEKEISSKTIAPKEIVSGIKRYLSGASSMFAKVIKISKGNLIVKEGRLYHKNLAPKDIDFDINETIEIVKEAIERINNELRSIARFGYDDVSAKKIAVALNVLYCVLDKMDELIKDNTLTYESKVDDTLLAKREELKAREQELINNLREYAKTIDTSVSEMSENEYLESDSLIDLEIPLGKISDSSDSGFDEFVKENVPELKLGGELITLNKEHPVYFLETDPDLLSEDYYDLTLEKIIYEAFLHFKAKNLQVALIEDKINSPVLKPILNNLSLTVSSSLSFHNEVANDESKATQLLNKLFNEYNDRVSRFKSFRALSKSGKCDDIYDYNKENPIEPTNFILFIYKDFPSFNKTEQDRRILKKLIEGGSNVGIFTLLIGNNVDSKPKFSGDKIIEKLDFEKLGIKEIKVTSEDVTFNGKNFSFIEPSLRKVNYLKLLKKRLDNSSKFFIDEILEDEKECPYYQRIKIPVGESNGHKVYFETATESKPYPFSIVTGSTGSGKSAFVHTLMMSAAYKYSPQEVEIHLVDFKSADKSTDFDGYRYVPGKENLYIPHIKYVSLKSRPENAVDVTNYIINLMAERSRYGKFEEYNRNAKPEKRIPQIYVIIDEYENMIKGGDGLDDNSIEKINLVSQINTNIETILKRARVFGIGVIFAGQDFTLKGKAPNQINTRFAFFNSESTLRASFPEPIDNFSKFPSDKKQSVGYCYVGSEGDTNPQYTHIAYAGSVDSDRLHKLAKRIREKYPEETAKHEQTIIGGNGSVIPEEGSYLDWDIENSNMIETTKMSFDSEEEFISSGSEESIKLFRPLTIGQSSSSEMTIAINYAHDSGKLAYYAFATKQDLCRIESNAFLAFLYQTRKLSYKKPRIIFLDASYDGVKDETIDLFNKEHPYIEKAVEYISGPLNIANKIMELGKTLEKGREKPFFIILHGLDFLTKESQKSWLKFEEPKVETKPVDEKKEAAFQKDREALEAKGGVTKSPLLSGFLSGIRSDAAKELPKEEKTQEKYTYLDLIGVLKKLYTTGSRSNMFLLVSSDSYLSINKVLFDNMKDIERDMNRFAIYGSFEMFKTKHKDTIPNANTCYVFNDKCGSTVRLYNYLAKESSSWWDNLDQYFKE